MSQFEDRYWTSQDGLKLHYRDYAAVGSASADRPPVLCMHGLTRNARDFEGVAPRLAANGWRVICPDMRGRGDRIGQPSRQRQDRRIGFICIGLRFVAHHAIVGARPSPCKRRAIRAGALTCRGTV